MTLTIRRVDSDKETGPFCKATVQVSQTTYTSTYRERAAKTERLGLDIEHCATPAKWKFGDDFLCHRHAADRALEILLAGSTAEVRTIDRIDA